MLNSIGEDLLINQTNSRKVSPTNSEVKRHLYLLSLFLFLFVQGFPFYGRTQSLFGEKKNKANFDEISRNRTYPGGSQEEDLKVQENLQEPQKVVYKNQIDEEVIREFLKSKESEKKK